ncbi:MAG: flippase-like domain-containing protein [Sphingobacteriaceae bacterium]|nr:flippase-like domain-containing protein [Sphingobacteriaceae bacterium]
MQGSKTKSVIQFIILLSIGVLLIWLSLRQVAPEKDNILKAFSEANYFWVFVSLLIAFFSHFLRAYRWNYLLEPLGYKTKLLNANCHVMVGYFANYGIPRMGEITRCTLAAKYDKVPFEVALGTVITERIVDFFIFIIIFVVTLFVQFNELIGLANELIFDKISSSFSGLMNKPILLGLILFFGIGLVAVFFLFRKKIAAKLKGKFGKVILGMLNGLSSVRKTKNPIQFIILSLLIWASYFYSLYFCFFAIDGTSHLGQKECLSLLLFGTLGVIFAPGGLGAYPFILYTILSGTYGVEDAPAFALPWLSWTGQFVLILVLGILSLLILPLYNKNKDVVQ